MLDFDMSVHLNGVSNLDSFYQNDKDWSDMTGQRCQSEDRCCRRYWRCPTPPLLENDIGNSSPSGFQWRLITLRAQMVNWVRNSMNRCGALISGLCKGRQRLGEERLLALHL